MLIIWTDCDREGEHIGSEIVEICRAVNPRLDIYRARYSAVTQSELRRSMANLQRLDLKQVAAVEARTELDLRSGAIFTRYQTLRLQREFPSINKEIISYGPCQFPTLGFVAEQYLKVVRFKPEPFWYLDLQIAKGDESNRFVWKRGHLFDQLITLILYERSIHASSGLAKITKVEEKPTSKFRPLPLRTVEFQKAASRFLKISSDQVMNLAEKLYNRGFISYPRTETDVFEFSGDQLRTLVQKQAADNVFGDYARDLIDSGGFRIPRKGKNNDKAHPPIHPTSSGEELSGQERAVFEFVARRFLACCSDDAKGLETKISAQIGVEEFECKGIRVTELNYLLVYKYEKWAEQEIAPFRQGETLEIGEYLMKEGKTSAPLLLSESDLITCMDKNGIGTDATIHEHIHKILVRKYAIKGRDSRFIPTRLGLSLVEAFDQLGLDLSLTQPKIRSKLERDLAGICLGNLSKGQVIEESKEMYRRVYRKVEDEFDRLMRVFRKYLGNGGNNPNNRSDSDNDDDDLPPGNPFDAMPLPRQTRSSADDNSDNDDNDGGESNGNTSKKRTRTPKSSSNKQNQYTSTTKKPRITAKSTKVNTSSAANVNCLCSLAAVKRTVSKDGANKGRQFWACSKDFNDLDNCKFFEWADNFSDSGNARSECANNNSTVYVYHDPKSSNGSYCNNQNNQNSFNRNAPIIDLDEDGDMRCSCGLIMKQDVMKTGKDAGRPFVKCPKIVQKCGMFLFLDGVAAIASGHGSSRGSSGSGAGFKTTTTKRSYNKTSSTTAGGKKQKCFKCKKTGHWANDCPN